MHVELLLSVRCEAINISVDMYIGLVALSSQEDSLWILGTHAP